MKDIRVLYVEDSARNREDLKALLPGTLGDDYRISLDCEESFENAAKKSRDYHLLILDLYQGPATEGGVNLGERVFEEIKASVFCPIVFYSGNVLSVKDMRSRVIGVVRKGEDNELEVLKSEILRLIKNGIPTLREKVHVAIDEEFRRFFWETIQKRNDIFKADEEDFSLGYLLLRNFADALSKDYIKAILEDSSIMDDKVHPMEFYIYPMEKAREFECGEIVIHKENRDVFVILTPSCDFIKRKGKKRKAEHVLLAKTVLFTSTSEYKSLVDINNQIAENDKRIGELVREAKATEELRAKREELEQTKGKKISSFKQLVNSGSSDRFFFLPGTPFIEDRVIDFQDKLTVSYESLFNDFERLAKLDNPYAQSMISSFIRYYNRIGFPDIDVDFIIGRLGL